APWCSWRCATAPAPRSVAAWPRWMQEAPQAGTCRPALPALQPAAGAIALPLRRGRGQRRPGGAADRLGEGCVPAGRCLSRCLPPKHRLRCDPRPTIATMTHALPAALDAELSTLLGPEGWRTDDAARRAHGEDDSRQWAMP